MKIIAWSVFIVWNGYWLVRLMVSVVQSIRHFARLDALSEAENRLIRESLVNVGSIEEQERVLNDSKIIRQMWERELAKK